ncbi:MAG: hypothetical protein ABH876_01340 [Patescibacteria group bacterium]
MSKIIKKYGKITLVLGLILTMVGTYLIIPISQAADASGESDTLSDSRPTVLANHDIKFKMDASTTIANLETVTLTFNSFTHGATPSVIGDWKVLYDTNGVSTYTDLPESSGANWTFATGSGASPVYTFTFTTAGATLIGTDKYIQITFTNGTGKLPNPAVGTYKIDIAGTFGDTGVTYVAVVDGVSVTATVAESLTFSIDETILDFGTIPTDALRYTTGGAASGGGVGEAGAGEPAQITAATNAAGGLSVTIRSIGDGGGNAGLYSSSTTNLIAAATPLATDGVDAEYAAYAKNASGITIVSGFEASGTTALTTTAQPFLSIAAAGSGTVDLSAKAGITDITEAASDYTDTLVVVATPTY